MPVIEYVARPDHLLIMPYCPLGSFQDGDISERQGIAALPQVLEAVGFLHPNKVAHRNIKPANILINTIDPFNIVISDFGMSKQMADGKFLKTFCGSYYYLAPEVLQGSSSYDQVADIWSVGIVFSQIFEALPVMDGDAKPEDTRANKSSGYFGKGRWLARL